jgi:hypothetical protein
LIEVNNASFLESLAAYVPPSQNEAVVFDYLLSGLDVLSLGNR